MNWLIDTAGMLMSSISKENYLLASVDYLYLFKPGKIGDVIRVSAEATAGWESSVEIKVKACIKREDREELGTLGLTTYVAVDENNRPRVLPEKIGVNEEVNRRKLKRIERKRKDAEDIEDSLP